MSKGLYRPARKSSVYKPEQRRKSEMINKSINILQAYGEYNNFISYQRSKIGQKPPSQPTKEPKEGEQTNQQ